MKRKNNLDEMQEQELLKIEHNGCWLAFWGLLISMIVQSCILRRPVATGAFASGHPALAVAGFNQSLSVQS